MTPGDRVTQLYPQALGTHFSRVLRHAWVTVGLFFNVGHHTGFSSPYFVQIHISLTQTTCAPQTTKTAPGGAPQFGNLWFRPMLIVACDLRILLSRSRLCHYSVADAWYLLFLWIVLVPCAGDRGGEWRGEYDLVSNRDLLKLTPDLTTRWATGNYNFVYSSLWGVKSYDMGLSRFTSHPKGRHAADFYRP
jgi:hypothetical protein